MTIQLTDLPSSFRSDFYTLALFHAPETIAITMRSLTHIYTTRQLPFTRSFLQEMLPNIFRTECYNYARLSFAQEVRATELGHLFEHILLTYLCEIQRKQGIYSAVYRAETSWNWRNDAWGTFHITLGIDASEARIFHEALTKSILLLNKILTNHNSTYTHISA